MDNPQMDRPHKMGFVMTFGVLCWCRTPLPEKETPFCRLIPVTSVMVRAAGHNWSLQDGWVVSVGNHFDR